MLQYLSAGSLALVVLGSFFVHQLLRYISDPLRDIPGPFSARFTRLWYLFAVYKGDFESTNINLHNKYGPVVRMAPNEYSIDNYEAAKTIYGHGNSFVKAPWYGAWTPPQKINLFGDRDPVHHAAQKRKFTSAYSMSSLVGYEPFVDECSSLLTQRLSEFANSHHTLNLCRWLQFYAFDVVGYITFGKTFGFLETGEDKTGIIKALEDRSAYCAFIGIYPILHKYIFPLLPQTGAYGYLVKFSQDSVAAREKALKDSHDTTSEGPPDFMTKLFNAHSADPERVTRDDVLTIATSNIGAGSDTTAITLSAIFYYLLKNPSTYNRLQSEIDTFTKEGKLSDPVTFKEGQEFRYLQAVIKEALRMHPATGLPLVRIVPSSGANLAGRDFPPGITVGINPWVAHHNPSVYGPDADRWRPERWLEIEEQGRGGEIEKYSMAFGLGSRTCIGKNVALLELTKVVPQLLRRFDFVLDESLRDREWTLKNIWFTKQADFKGRVVLREKK